MVRSQDIISKNIIFLSLKVVFILANSADPDEMLHHAAVHLGLHCLPKYPFSTQVITKEIIWNNSQIKCNNKILFYHDWYEKGIKLIEHIYDFRVQRFYTLEQLQNLYNIHQKDFLKYYNIVSNISKEWKNKLKDENYNNLPKKINKALHIITQQKGSINKSLNKLQLDVEKVPTRVSQK